MLARLLDRHQRLLRIAVVVLCGGFGLRAVLDVMDALEGTSAWAAEAPRPPAPGPAGPSAIGGPAREPALRSAGSALVDRNIFCSGCAPAAATPAAAVATDHSGTPPATTLPLHLIATHVASSAASRSSATVLDGATANQGAYRVGEHMPGAGAIVRIGGRSVDFENPGAGRVERLTMSERAPAETKPAAESAEPAEQTPARRGRASDPELTAALDAGVRAIDENTFEVERGLIESVIARPQSAARGARVSMRDGGLRLAGVRPDSAHARLGLKSGDTVLAVNGVELASPDKMLEAVTRLRTESTISLSVMRRRQPVTLTYRIR